MKKKYILYNADLQLIKFYLNIKCYNIFNLSKDIFVEISIKIEIKRMKLNIDR